jgi:hypothetical protein
LGFGGVEYHWHRLFVFSWIARDFALLAKALLPTRAVAISFVQRLLLLALVRTVLVC